MVESEQAQLDVFSERVLSLIHCPYCDGDLVVERGMKTERGTHGILSCSCHRYPVLNDIVFLTQGSFSSSGTVDRLVRLLERDEFDSALYEVVSAPIENMGGVWFRNFSRLKNPLATSIANIFTKRAIATALDPEATFCDVARAVRRPLFAEYLIHRYANPSFMAAVPLLLVLGKYITSNYSKSDMVLDVACGAGHSCALLHSVFPSLTLIATDHDPVNLLLAKRLTGERTVLMCLDVEKPLPFRDKSFSGILCQDSFHYVHSKAALFKEIKRVAAADSILLFPHLHNALCSMPAPGLPLSPDDYLRLFESFPGKLFSEEKLLESFVREGTVDLTKSDSSEELLKTPNLTYVGSREKKVWSEFLDICSVLLRAKEYFAVNPIFSQQRSGSQSLLRRRWRYREIEAECSSAKKYIPEEFRLDLNMLEGIRKRNVGCDIEDAERLIRKFILVPLASSYGNADGR